MISLPFFFINLICFPLHCFQRSGKQHNLSLLSQIMPGPSFQQSKGTVFGMPPGMPFDCRPQVRAAYCYLDCF